MTTWPAAPPRCDCSLAGLLLGALSPRALLRLGRPTLLRPRDAARHDDVNGGGLVRLRLGAGAAKNAPWDAVSECAAAAGPSSAAATRGRGIRDDDGRRRLDAGCGLERSLG